MKNPTKRAIVKATSENVNVYLLKNGNYHDADAMGNNEAPTAKKAGKKEFTKDELIFI